MNAKVHKILEQYKHEPKQTELTSFFESVRVYSSNREKNKNNKTHKTFARKRSVNQMNEKSVASPSNVHNGLHRERKITYDWDTSFDDGLIATALDCPEIHVASASNVVTDALKQPVVSTSNVDNGLYWKQNIDVTDIVKNGHRRRAHVDALINENDQAAIEAPQLNAYANYKTEGAFLQPLSAL